MAEDYVRPAIVALEVRGHQAGVWGFRLVIVLLIAAIAVGLFFLGRALFDNGTNNAQGLAYHPLRTAPAR